MRYDGYDSDNAVGRREICRSFTCASPWFLFCRWFNGGKSRVLRNRSVGRNWGEEDVEGDLDVHRKSGIVSSSSRQNFSEIREDASFNVGVGYGLIFLVRNEVNKMVELRKRIELLLEKFRIEIDNQETIQHYIPSRASLSSSLSKTRVQEIPYDEEHDSGRCLFPDSGKDSQIGFGSNPIRREKSMRMDQLEAELEAEFDRLQLQIEDGEFCLNYSEQQFSEENMDGNAPEFDEETSELHLHETSNDDFQGVSPIELERKLHQVLDERRLKRINELESALDYAMQQLEEKERELSWWKDSACEVSQHLPFISSLLGQVKQAMEEEVSIMEITTASANVSSK